MQPGTQDRSSTGGSQRVVLVYCALYCRCGVNVLSGIGSSHAFVRVLFLPISEAFLWTRNWIDTILSQ